MPGPISRVDIDTGRDPREIRVPTGTLQCRDVKVAKAEGYMQSSPLTDAMGCQKKIARQIVNREADYILAVKENQRRLLEDVTRPVFLWAENRS